MYWEWRKKCWLHFMMLLLGPTCAMTLPEGEQVIHGEVNFLQSETGSLEITASDKAIVNYASFNIGEQERVRFIQPGSESCVLNRIVGENPSMILGSMEANGRVFLVNPNGVYFGSNASVNVGSLIVSTLNIEDQDFLNDRLHFVYQERSSIGVIENLGHIHAPEGVIAFLASHIRNEGIIIANAGKVLLASTEAVTLDFSGDGLFSFVLEGDLEQATIEQLGIMHAPAGEIFLKMQVAHRAIQEVVNVDGIVVGDTIVKRDGSIYIAQESVLVGKAVTVDAGQNAHVVVEGEIDAVNLSSGEGGGTIAVLAEDIYLLGAKLDASGMNRGGSVCLGGNYKGQGPFRNASNVYMDETSIIAAVSIHEGDGGSVILWSDDTTVFNGTIIAEGGILGGNGGFVETSGKQRLIIETGRVDLSSRGGMGSWFLDPADVTISNAGGGSYASVQCGVGTGGSVSISPATLSAVGGNVCIEASNSIIITDAISLTTAGATLTFDGLNSATTNLNANVTTNAAAISFTNTNVVVGAAVTLTTGGGNVSFTGTVNGQQNLTINAGVGAINMAGIGNSTPVGTMLVTASTVNFGGAVTLAGNKTLTVTNSGVWTIGAVTITAPGGIAQNGTGSVTVSGNAALVTSNGGIAFSSVINASGDLIVQSGSAGDKIVALAGISSSGSLTVSGSTVDLGGSVTLGASKALTVTNSNIWTIGAVTITAPGGITQNGASTTTLSGNATLATTNSGVTFTTAINGSPNLTISAGTGAVSLAGIGNSTPLGTILVTASTVNFGGSVTLATNKTLTVTNSGVWTIGAVTITAPGGIAQNGTGSVTISGNAALITSNGGIAFSSVIGGSGDLTIQSGSSGDKVVTLAGVSSLGNLSVVGSTINLGGSVILGSSKVLTVTNSGVWTIGAVTITAPGGIIQDGSSTISSAGNMVTAGGAIDVLGAITLTGSISMDTTNSGASPSGANISLGAVSGSYALTCDAGIGAIALSEDVSIAGPLSLTAGNVYCDKNISTTAPGTGDISFIGDGVGGVYLGNSQVSGGVWSCLSEGTITTVSSSISFTDIDLWLKCTDSNVAAIATTASSSSGSDIAFRGTIDSFYEESLGCVNAVKESLIVDAGTTGNITFEKPVGAVCEPAKILVTGQDITILSSSSLKGTNGGVVILTNYGTLQIDGTINARGGLTQNGPGGVELKATLLTSGDNVEFYSPVVITGTPFIDTNTSTLGQGNIIFHSAIDGDGVDGRMLTLHAASDVANIPYGDVYLLDAVGSTNPLAITLNAANFTAEAVTVTAFTQTAGDGITTFNGVLQSSGEITLEGDAFVFYADVSTNGAAILVSGTACTLGNAVLISSTDSAPIGADITFDVPIDGDFSLEIDAGSAGVITFNEDIGSSVPLASFDAHGDVIHQNGSLTTNNGVVSYHSTLYLGGDIFTGGAMITIESDVIRSGINNITIDSSGGNILFTGTVDADNTSRNLTITAGSGAVTMAGIIGQTGPLNNLSITAGAITFDAGIGSGTVGIVGSLSVMASSDITFTSSFYGANNQSYTTDTVYINTGSPTIYQASSGSIVFTGGTIFLSSGSALSVFTNNSPLTIANIQAADPVSVLLFSGTGSLHFGNIGTTGIIGGFAAMGGTMTLTGSIVSDASMILESVNNIVNGDGYTLSSTTAGLILLDSSNGSIGTASHPIGIDLPNATLVLGAAEKVYLSGTVRNNTFYCSARNRPQQVILNGVVSSCTNSAPVSETGLPANIFFVPGVTTNQGSLAGPMYYNPDFADETLVDREIPIFALREKSSPKPIQPQVTPILEVPQQVFVEEPIEEVVVEEQAPVETPDKEEAVSSEEIVVEEQEQEVVPQEEETVEEVVVEEQAPVETPDKEEAVSSEEIMVEEQEQEVVPQEVVVEEEEKPLEQRVSNDEHFHHGS